MSAVPRIRLAADYDCYPTWVRDEGPYNVDPAALAIPHSLATELMLWAGAYDRTLNRSDPSTSGFSTAIEHQVFVSWGRALSGWLAAELNEPVEYFDDGTQRPEVVDPAG